MAGVSPLVDVVNNSIYLSFSHTSALSHYESVYSACIIDVTQLSGAPRW